MTVENKHPYEQKTLRQLAATKAALWIDDASGQLIELTIESRIRPGEDGCQLCREALDGTERHGRVEFGHRNLPRLVFGPGGGICCECVEWVRLLDYHAEHGSVSTPRFDDGDLVLRVGTEELYEVLESKLSGIAATGVWFPIYSCQRIEIREATGEILPACRGLLFEIADCELQPVPPRYPFPPSSKRTREKSSDQVDLVGGSPRRVAIISATPTRRPPMLPDLRRPLLTDKRGGP